MSLKPCRASDETDETIAMPEMDAWSVSDCSEIINQDDHQTVFKRHLPNFIPMQFVAAVHTRSVLRSLLQVVLAGSINVKQSKERHMAS